MIYLTKRGTQIYNINIREAWQDESDNVFFQYAT